jgi:hypothetical protein
MGTFCLSNGTKKTKGEKKMDTDKIMEGLDKELVAALKAMAKTKDLNEKESYSRIIKNLCESQGVFLNLMTEMMPYDYDDDDFDDDVDDYDDDDVKDKDIPF